jgi:membrane protein YqaA with SNARE-associated domain
VIGDPLCLLAGIFRISFLRFSVLVFVGKFFRYAILALLATQSSGG